VEVSPSNIRFLSKLIGARPCELLASAEENATAARSHRHDMEAVMLQRIEMDEHVPLADQLAGEVGPVTLINTFKVAPQDTDALLEAWAADAAYLKSKPGFISTQLYRGIAGSGVFVNQAVWESVAAFRTAFGDPQFQATFGRYPDSTVASPHLFQKVAVPGICVDR
jgi:heme-degrading monooxygenase HmoA